MLYRDRNNDCENDLTVSSNKKRVNNDSSDLLDNRDDVESDDNSFQSVHSNDNTENDNYSSGDFTNASVTDTVPELASLNSEPMFLNSQKVTLLAEIFKNLIS